MLDKIRTGKSIATTPRAIGRQYSIIFMRMPMGGEYEMLDKRRAKQIKPGKSYKLGTGLENDIMMPFRNRDLGFQAEWQGEVFIGEGDRLKYKDVSDIGSAVIKFKKSLMTDAIEDVEAIPGVSSIEHVSKGKEVDISEGNAIVVLGVHEGTVANNNLFIISMQSVDETICPGIRDEFEWGHVRPAFLALVS